MTGYEIVKQKNTFFKSENDSETVQHSKWMQSWKGYFVHLFEASVE